MALCPFAKHKLIPPGSNDPPIDARAAVCHVDAGGAETLYSYFRYRSGGVESHFHIRWTGVIEQYRDTDRQADANLGANDFAVSIETQGFGNGKWRKRQLRSLKRLLRWLHEVEGIPLRKIGDPYGSGVGYHVQFGAPGPWTPVAKSCPGPKRIKQYENVLVPWMAGGAPTEEGDMSWSKKLAFWRPGGSSGKMPAGQQLNQARGYAHAAYSQSRPEKLAEAVHGARLDTHQDVSGDAGWQGKGTRRADYMLEWAYAYSRATHAEMAGMREAVRQLAAAQGADPEQIGQAVQAAVSQALASYEGSLTFDEKEN